MICIYLTVDTVEHSSVADNKTCGKHFEMMSNDKCKNLLQQSKVMVSVRKTNYNVAILSTRMNRHIGSKK